MIIGTVICMNAALLNKVKTRMRTIHLAGAEKWRVRPFNKSGRNLFLLLACDVNSMDIAVYLELK